MAVLDPQAKLHRGLTIQTFHVCMISDQAFYSSVTRKLVLVSYYSDFLIQTALSLSLFELYLIENTL